jgi:hypothetical protein
VTAAIREERVVDTAVVVLIVLVLLAVVLGLVLMRRRRSAQLREHFGPEYERSVSTAGDPRAAEAELAARQKRREEFDVRDLRPDERTRFRDSWNEIQRKFVDDPRGSLRSADVLVAEIMRARGYPVDDDFDRRADDMSVDHPRVVQYYREARQVHDASGRDSDAVDTERQRTAVTSYRKLVDALLGSEESDDRDADERPADHDRARTGDPLADRADERRAALDDELRDDLSDTIRDDAPGARRGRHAAPDAPGGPTERTDPPGSPSSRTEERTR